MKHISLLSGIATVALSVAGFVVPVAHAQSAPSIVFNYNDDQQVLSVSLSDNSTFAYEIGTDQIGDGSEGYVNTNLMQTSPGSFGDSLGSEWLITNDPAGGSVPPCGIPNYTGDPSTDFASCISAITADGGTYAISTFGTVSADPGTDTSDVYTVDTTSSSKVAPNTDSDITTDAVKTLPTDEAQMTTKGFEMLKGSVIPDQFSKKVTKVDGPLVKQMVSSGILKKSGSDYVFQKNYYFASPSQASALALNSLSNGWTVWVTQQKITTANASLASTKKTYTLGQLWKHQ